MNRIFSKKNAGGTGIFSVLLAAVFLAPALLAQPAARTVDNRLLLVFDTSSAMKKCLPVTAAAMTRLCVLSLSDQLRPGDTIGVWTFGADAGTGQFPLQVWKPEAAAMIASNINVFIGHQHYANSTKFGPLMQLVNSVAQDSERLTVLIFCDGDGQFQGTPYDAAVNALFRQNQRATQQAKQPFVVVLRSQLGQYTGCQISSPPSSINFPEFPPLPLPPAPTASVPPPAPPAPVPSLIIIGTHVGTNLPPPEPKPAPIEPKPALTNLPTVQTTTPVVLVTMVTNIIVAPTNPVVQTNAAMPPPENSDAGGKKPMVIGAVLLVVAGLLTAVVAFRMRRSDHGSLITRSMNRKK